MPSVTGTIQVVSVRGGGAVDGLRPVYTLLLLFDCYLSQECLVVIGGWTGCILRIIFRFRIRQHEYNAFIYATAGISSASNISSEIQVPE